MGNLNPRIINHKQDITDQLTAWINMFDLSLPFHAIFFYFAEIHQTNRVLAYISLNYGV